MAGKKQSAEEAALREEAHAAFIERLANHLTKNYGKKFKPFPVVSAIPAALAGVGASLWEVPRKEARRRLAETCVDDCHLDRGDLVVWK